MPLVVLVVATFVGIYLTCRSAAELGKSLRDVIGNSDSYQTMMWASLLAVLVAGLGETVDSWFASVR